MRNNIYVKGAKQHNLKNITVEIPRNQLVIFTGVSGSGKSSLVFNTIYSEGRKRLMDSLSSYERMSLKKPGESLVDLIEGLSPTIAIEQKTVSKNSRSTVGTLTDLYSYVRLLFSRASSAFCPYCKEELPVLSKKKIIDYVVNLPYGYSIDISAPILSESFDDLTVILNNLNQKGFHKVVLNEQILQVEEALDLLTNIKKKKNISIQAHLGNITIKPQNENIIKTKIEKALEIGMGLISIKADGRDSTIFHEIACKSCNVLVSEISASEFSYNSPYGACTTCTGLGTQYYVDKNLVIPNKDRSISEGAINIIGWQFDTEKFHKNRKILEGLAKEYKFDLNTAVKDLPTELLNVVLYGTNGKKIRIENPSQGGKDMYEKFSGVINLIYDRFNSNAKDDMSTIKEEDKTVIRERPCPNCGGTRLKAQRLLYRINGLTINELTNMSVNNLVEFCEDSIQFNNEVSKSYSSKAIPILKNMRERLILLNDIGLGYLTLNRPVNMLSGGESQRIRLTTQLGSGLMGLIYILDEPSVGLHPKDSEKMISMLTKLRDLGNSLIVVEHDDDIISKADYLIDIGPGAGSQGGEIIAQGTVEEVMRNPSSLTGHYLSGKKRISIPSKRRGIENTDNYLEITGAKKNNLKNLNIRIPLARFVGVTGVSGSGKSTLVNDVIYKELLSIKEGQYKSDSNSKVRGVENIDDVIYIDQMSIGRTPRSNPATYIGIFNIIRRLFAKTDAAQLSKYKESHFSFNTPGGRCEECLGLGIIVTQMHFMPDIEMICESCHGKRYNAEILNITYNGKNIVEVLDMSIKEAAQFFLNQPKIYTKLDLMSQMGLGYMKLGQSATTLSGGEAQRIKLVYELSKLTTGSSNLYILDEPTTGLHLDDIQRLLDIFQKLVGEGHTVLVIEHNLQLIKTVDYLIDLGPGGGVNGGNIVATGTPEEVSKNANSYTGQYLRKILNGN
ncbi:excinuclease ABC subunit UvrA [Metabacillus idriensis]|uniref:UvrABC system protein A n=1 Tax=Metabacillus idriensis TaxID=324768 RepID=A0A6I2MD19_9BACI|nr:excinuclease ABC subunit UvrA [Metabacillus idriensis]MCM3598083.1 excinuclease ABC subunit UvrA [Metabacillus idriensis]MRX56168.1 excinuclease ABC subunit UvrA [Metabacillus idriensis]